jgi:hypothetical protein
MKTLKLIALAILIAMAAGTANSATRDIYPDPAQAKADLAGALKTAAATHKRFCWTLAATGAATARFWISTSTTRPTGLFSTPTSCWCTSTSAPWMRIRSWPRRYGVPLEKGVPALAVLSDKGSCFTARRAASSKPCGACSPPR